ncbi:MAG: DUF1934 domain-containing protein [Oscillospiraceae bacterium]|nr:DUF1934 domain-containing protein [Oscillospiraceae bacterium]
MEREVLLTITGTQRFRDEAPETTKLVTEGVMRCTDGAVELSYEETELTGLSGTKTTFRIEGARVVLSRTGTVESRMVFAVGQEEHSLYDIGYGALMIAVRAERICSDVGENGGTLQVAYAISIEEEMAGEIEYLIEVRPKRK